MLPTTPTALQEIKTAKLQQKLLTKSVVELQRNASVQYAELTGDMASLAASLAKVSAARLEQRHP